MKKNTELEKTDIRKKIKLHFDEFWELTVSPKRDTIFFLKNILNDDIKEITKEQLQKLEKRLNIPCKKNEHIWDRQDRTHINPIIEWECILCLKRCTVEYVSCPKEETLKELPDNLIRFKRIDKDEQ